LKDRFPEEEEEESKNWMVEFDKSEDEKISLEEFLKVFQ